MRALISMQEKDYSWFREIFPDIHPAMVQIANKPLLEYLVDFAILNGCSEVRLVMEELGRPIREYFGDGSRWGISISYNGALPGETIDQHIAKNSKYCADDSLLILKGFFFIHYDKQLDYKAWYKDSQSALIAHCTGGTVLYRTKNPTRNTLLTVTSEVNFALTSLRSLNDIHHVAMEVLDAEQYHYVLPGYGKEKGVLFGRNTEIDKSVRFVPPVIIGDNVSIHGECVIGPWAAIGNDSIIDAGTGIEQSLVLPCSYVGRNLSFNRKIVNGRQLYSVAENEWLKMEDDVLLSVVEVQDTQSAWRSLVDRLQALILLAVLLPAYSLFYLFKKTGGEFADKELVFFSRYGRVIRSRGMVAKRATIAGRVFTALSLDRFHLLRAVLAGKLYLVGNRILPAREEKHGPVQIPEHYRPGVFAYTEAENIVHGSMEEEVAESFMAVNNSLLSDCKILCKVLKNNFQSLFRTNNHEVLQ